MASLVSKGIQLPQSDEVVECVPFIVKLVTCYGPRGLIRSLYREGDKPSCERESINAMACLKAKYAGGEEKKEETLQQARMDAAKASLKRWQPTQTQPQPQSTDAPLLYFRWRNAPPPDFHQYQHMSDAEVDSLVHSLVGSASSTDAPIVQ